MKRSVSVMTLAMVFVFGVTAIPVQGDDMTFPGTKTQWNGYTMYSFDLDCGQYGKRPVNIVCPQKVDPKRRWVWRAVYFGHEPQTELAMLARGYHIAFIKCTDSSGSPKQVAQRNVLYDFLVKEKGFDPKPCLIGMSLGGITNMNWAIAHADKVGPIYIDNPVLDIRALPSSPLRRPASQSRNKNWDMLMSAYEFKSDDEAKAYKYNPVDAYQPLIQNHVPILLMCATSDSVIPYELNGKVLWERMKKDGGIVELVLKPGHDHHPHSLKDPTLIVNFFTNPPKTCSQTQTTYSGK
ncbi:MAG: prolyl oligopeptidase family serine peptidase [Thermoguttaceae bacterium]|nr:prolyl oligopeptidase family serine peptidase [Thermoguttaceae bacterium]